MDNGDNNLIASTSKSRNIEDTRAFLGDISESTYKKLYLYNSSKLGRHYVAKDTISKNEVFLSVYCKETFSLQHRIQFLFGSSILKEIKNIFMPPLVYTFQNDTHCSCVFLKPKMLIPFRDAAEWARSHSTMDQNKFYFVELALAINYVHQYDFFFAALIPDYLYLDENGHLKICCSTIGILTKAGDRHNVARNTHTMKYMAPEVIRMKTINKYVDWWSYGVIMYEFFVGTLPIMDYNSEDILERYLGNICRGDNNIYVLLLNMTPQKRLCFHQGIIDLENHPFFHRKNLFQRVQDNPPNYLPPFLYKILTQENSKMEPKPLEKLFLSTKLWEYFHINFREHTNIFFKTPENIKGQILTGPVGKYLNFIGHSSLKRKKKQKRVYMALNKISGKPYTLKDIYNCEELPNEIIGLRVVFVTPNYFC